MKSFTAFSRRLMLSLLVAFWTISLIYATWRFITDQASARPIGFEDLSLPLLARHCSPHALFLLQLLFSVATIALAATEARCNRHHDIAITHPPPHH